MAMATTKPNHTKHTFGMYEMKESLIAMQAVSFYRLATKKLHKTNSVARNKTMDTFRLKLLPLVLNKTKKKKKKIQRFFFLILHNPFVTLGCFDRFPSKKTKKNWLT